VNGIAMHCRGLAILTIGRFTLLGTLAEPFRLPGGGPVSSEVELFIGSTVRDLD
jgi:hypothetical protein